MTAQRYRMTLILSAASPSTLCYHETSPARPYQPRPFVPTNKMALSCSLHLISLNSHTFSCSRLGLIIISHSVNKLWVTDAHTNGLSVLLIHALCFNCTERKKMLAASCSFPHSIIISWTENINKLVTAVGTTARSWFSFTKYMWY